MTTEEGSTRQEVYLPGIPGAVLMARQALNNAIPPPVLSVRDDDARLVLSEVITNAVKYGLADEKGFIHLTIDADEDHLRIDVEQSAASAAMVTEPHDFGGFGLRIVDALADEWGSEPGPPGRVWFEFRI